MSRDAQVKYRYGLAGAGAVSKSLIGMLPGIPQTLGPVCGVAYRVASRIANTLGGGFPVRKVADLGGAPVILFHAPPDQAGALLKALDAGELDWSGRSLVVCDCFLSRESLAVFAMRGASVATVRQFEAPGHLVMEGTGGALLATQKIARDLSMKAIEITGGAADVFDAAVTMGTCALTPLIDRTAMLFREAGLRDAEATRLAALLFQQTTRDYSHSGKQSWGWYLRKPEQERVLAQIAMAGPFGGEMLRQLIQFGMHTFDKHDDVAQGLAKIPD